MEAFAEADRADFSSRSGGGIANIRADQVWDQYGTRGEGITVASLDSGVQFDHPALVEQYRGNLGDGGASWQNVSRFEDETTLRQQKTIPIPQAGGEPQVQMRFHYRNSSNGFYWQLDNLLVGRDGRACFVRTFHVNIDAIESARRHGADRVTERRRSPSRASGGDGTCSRKVPFLR